MVMKLFLTSNGLSNLTLEKKFVELLNKDPSEISVIVIGSIVTKKNFKYINNLKKQLNHLGIRMIKVANIAKSIKADVFGECDVIIFMGGNTYYLLDRARKTGVIRLIKKHISSGGIYLGISAGSIIIHKTIEFAGWGKSADTNLIGLQDLRGVGIITTAIFPHYRKILHTEIVRFKRNTSYPIQEIRDGEAIIINGKKIELIKK